MSKKKVLIQVDPDENASVFDSMVAFDSGIDDLLVQSNISVEQVTGIVHGAIFTRSMDNLKSTALFFGGSNVSQTEALVEQAKRSFFGPLTVSMMSDPNGSNTTAAAAVLSAGQHVQWCGGGTVTILAATGPVGSRIATILGGQANEKLTVRICSRKLSKATTVADELNAKFSNVNFVPLETSDPTSSLSAIENSDVVFAAGAAGIELLPDTWSQQVGLPKVLVDLNAVPPLGIPGVEVMDKGRQLFDSESICYGAIGVGGLKMKIHRRCVEQLFESNDQVLLVNEIFAVGQSIVGSKS